jgi:hypothetical protein
MGRFPGAVVYERARADIDAISVNHMSGTPFNFDTKDYLEGKKNVADYCARQNARFGES